MFVLFLFSCGNKSNNSQIAEDKLYYDSVLKISATQQVKPRNAISLEVQKQIDSLVNDLMNIHYAHYYDENSNIFLEKAKEILELDKYNISTIEMVLYYYEITISFLPKTYQA